MARSVHNIGQGDFAMFSTREIGAALAFGLMAALMGIGSALWVHSLGHSHALKGALDAVAHKRALSYVGDLRTLPLEKDGSASETCTPATHLNKSHHALSRRVIHPREDEVEIQRYARDDVFENDGASKTLDGAQFERLTH